MTTPAPSARSLFAAWAASSDPDQGLAEGALLVAAEEYPQISVAHYLQRLELLADRVRDRAGEETAPLVILQELNRVLFEDEGFRGNSGAYYDPRNCLLNDVLDRRLGIPITLGIVYLEVGWKLGLPLQGINFPGHFLVRYNGEAVRFLIDCFDRGRIRFEDDALQVLDRGSAASVRLRPEYMTVAGRRDVLARLLANLKRLYTKSGDDARALAAVERLLVLRPDSPTEIRDRGLLLARIGREEEAGRDLERYLDAMPHAPDAHHIRMMLRQLEVGEDQP
ncbi:MAG TPA: transglutaminase-like domain-containing protein [Longimicrobiales bacterium]|nr:transglutaminase-like domain-containing protein [Longimicrobiales bacterium]